MLCFNINKPEKLHSLWCCLKKVGGSEKSHFDFSHALIICCTANRKQNITRHLFQMIIFVLVQVCASKFIQNKFDTSIADSYEHWGCDCVCWTMDNGHDLYRYALAIVNATMIKHFTAIKIDIICAYSVHTFDVKYTRLKFNVSIKRAPATHSERKLAATLLLIQTLGTPRNRMDESEWMESLTRLSQSILPFYRYQCVCDCCDCLSKKRIPNTI